MFNLLPPQSRVKNEIVKDVVAHLSKRQYDKLRTRGFTAPTGSGKTIILTHTIQDIAKQLNNQVAFIWLTIGKGSLVDQCTAKIKDQTEGISIIKAQDLSAIENLAGSVLVINWDTLNKTDEDGQAINIIMKSDDNFPTICEKTRQANIPIVLIIDESHLYANTDKSLVIRNKHIKPTYTLEVSATPKTKKWHGSSKITTKEASDSGLIKKEIKQITFETTVSGIRIGAKKLQSLISLASENQVGYIPKMLVFIPNATEGKNPDLDLVLALLENEFEWKEEAGDVVVWMSDRKSKNYEDCKDNNGQCKVILTKEAIDTGVDIPSVQIIVQLRPAGNRRTELQKIGRGLRMPYQKHYGNDLDRLFFYVFDDYEIDNTDAEYVLDLLEDKFKFVKNVRDVGRRIDVAIDGATNSAVGWYNVLANKVKDKINGRPAD